MISTDLYKIITPIRSDESRSKRSGQVLLERSRRPGDRYQDDHCVDHYAIEDRTIIRTKDSKERGAVFLNESEVTTSKQQPVVNQSRY